MVKTSRQMLETKALFQIICQSPNRADPCKTEDVKKNGSKYSSPVAKMALTPSLRFGAICKCHVAQSGRSMLSKSDNTLTALDTNSTMFLSIQWLP